MRNPVRRLITDLVLVVRDLPPAIDGPGDQRVRRTARGITELYGAMAAAVALWVVYLAFALPERSTALHYDVTWVGFDCFLIATMLGTAYWAYRLDPRVQLAANATATLLLVDAWMDITTAPDTAAFRLAVGMAILLELPLALLSLRVARNVNRRIAERARQAVRLASTADQAQPPTATV